MKKVESLDEAEARILSLKCDEREQAIIRRVFDMWRAGRMPRPEKRLSKKGVMEAYEAYLLAERERKKAKVLASKRDNCWIVTDEETLAKLEAALDDEDVITLDTETTGLDWFVDRIVGIAGYFPRLDVDFYVPYGHIDPNDKDAFIGYGVKHGFDAAIEKYRLTWLLPQERVLAFYAKAVKKRTGWHNYDYDCVQSTNVKVEPDPPYWDTLTCQRILNDNEESYSLKALHAKYIEPDGEAITFEDLFDDMTIFDKDVVLAGIYAGGDGRKTYNVMMFQKRYIDTVDNLRTVWYEIERPLIHINAMTQQVGINVDLDHLAKLHDEFTPRLEEARRKMYEAFGLPDDFNVDSPQQLAHLIYDIAGADPTFPKRFKKQERSTAKEVVDALCEDLPQLRPLLEYRQLAKLLGTYVDKIPQAIEPTTGRIHFALNSVGTDTGRYSSSEYVKAKHSRSGVARGLNIQNIPSRTKEGVEVRKAFIPKDGWLFVGSDLSQIEPRVIAHILYAKFGDDSMKRIYDAGLDIYTNSAMIVFSLDEQYCVDGAYDPTGTFKPRRLMKDGVLAYLYGQSDEAFARKMNVSIEVARRFFASMRERFPGLAPMKAWILDGLMTRGKIAFSETLDGGKRRYPDYRDNKRELVALEAKCFNDGLDIYRGGGPNGRTPEEAQEIAERVQRVLAGTIIDDDREALTRIGLYWRNKSMKDRFWQLRKNVSGVERAAVNHVIQGSAAHILKRNIIRLYGVCQERGWRFLTSIHDEVWLELPKSDVTPEALDLNEECMTKTVNLTVPLKSDSVIQPRWMEEYRRDEWDFDNHAPKRKEDDIHV